MSSPETSGASAAEVLPFHRPQVPAPNPLDVDGDRADNWKIWKQRWDNYCIITGLVDQPEDYKCAMLLHSIRIEAMRIFNGLKFSDGEDLNNMADIIKKFDQNFLGLKSSLSDSNLIVAIRNRVSQLMNTCLY